MLSKLNNIQKFVAGMVLIRLSKPLAADQRSQLIDRLCDLLFVEREPEITRIDDDIEREYERYIDAEDGETI